MIPVGLRMLKDKARSLIVYSLAAIGFLEMYIALFPTFKEQSEKLDTMMKSFPPEMFKALNMDPGDFSFSSLESYLSTEYMSFLWPILAIIFAISIANYIAVRDIDKGTIETMVSLPISRVQILVARYITGIKILAVFSLVSLFGAIPLAMLHNIDYKLENYLTAAIGSFFFIWAVYSLAVVFSVIFSEKGRATTFSGGTLMLMYVCNIVAGLNADLENLKYFSFFHYFSGSELLSKNTYPEWALLVLGLFAIAMAVIALVRFNKRDLSV